MTDSCWNTERLQSFMRRRNPWSPDGGRGKDDPPVLCVDACDVPAQEPKHLIARSALSTNTRWRLHYILPGLDYLVCRSRASRATSLGVHLIKRLAGCSAAAQVSRRSRSHSVLPAPVVDCCGSTNRQAPDARLLSLSPSLHFTDHGRREELPRDGGAARQPHR